MTEKSKALVVLFIFVNLAILVVGLYPWDTEHTGVILKYLFNIGWALLAGLGCLLGFKVLQQDKDD